MFNVTCSSFFNVTILTVVTQLGSTGAELQVVSVFAILAITSSVVVQELEL